jgi:hypothetical protein
VKAETESPKREGVSERETETASESKPEIFSETEKVPENEIVAETVAVKP